MRRFHEITVPKSGVSWIVRWVFEQMNDQRIGHGDLTERAGISENTITKWRKRSSPNFATVEAVVNALGYEIKLVRVRQ
ncbi:helix-turn-helix domain-containing protein [Paramagnetospirillum magneticum]|uniref:HTH cro/C1-type domain-containing protein n=1 Tax=Paramagnetospirillum magneticum (strain ATCC 700264 / AMB-1) TaxID=342108 RepID=Q2W3Q7_PARM1|nr:helix-turn-helix transcriptional regulator [Paramagnetospirillum magneticum]BAE51518.1 hypothetical protein amb2714 [Paramagnetospirillum magneticum AMB-1]